VKTSCLRIVLVASLALTAPAALAAAVVDEPDQTAPALHLLPVGLTSAAEDRAAARALPIPEPVSLAIFGTGLLLLFRRRRF